MALTESNARQDSNQGEKEKKRGARSTHRIIAQGLPIHHLKLTRVDACSQDLPVRKNGSAIERPEQQAATDRTHLDMRPEVKIVSGLGSNLRISERVKKKLTMEDAIRRRNTTMITFFGQRKHKDQQLSVHRIEGKVRNKDPAHHFEMFDTFAHECLLVVGHAQHLSPARLQLLGRRG